MWYTDGRYRVEGLPAAWGPRFTAGTVASGVIVLKAGGPLTFSAATCLGSIKPYLVDSYLGVEPEPEP